MTESPYERDFYAWSQAQVAALRAKDLAALDVDHLSEQVVNQPPGIEGPGAAEAWGYAVTHVGRWNSRPPLVERGVFPSSA